MAGRIALRQHNFSPKMEYAPGIPVILLTTTVVTKLETFMQCAGRLEISCLGAVRRISESTFLIYEVFLAEEANDGSFTEMHKRGLNKLAYEIMERPGGEEMLKDLRFWWHYHVDFGTTPSGHDENQTQVFVEEHKKDYPFFIRAIANRTGKIQFTLFLRSGITISDVPWELAVPQDDALIAQARKEYDEKIGKKQSVIIPARTTGTFGVRDGLRPLGDRGPHAAPGKRYGQPLGRPSGIIGTPVATGEETLAGASPAFFPGTPAGPGEEFSGAVMGNDARALGFEVVNPEAAVSAGVDSGDREGVDMELLIEEPEPGTEADGV